MNKKAQTEILGLAIIVVLVVIATILVVKFGFKNTNNVRTDFVNSEEASNFLNTFKETSAPDCSMMTMTDILEECMQDTGLECIKQDGTSQDSCDFVKSEAEKIFSKTLDLEKKKYEFLVCKNFDVKSITCYDSPCKVYVANPSNTCPSGTPTCPGQKKLKIFPIPINPGIIYAKLEICN